MRSFCILVLCPLLNWGIMAPDEEIGHNLAPKRDGMCPRNESTAEDVAFLRFLLDGAQCRPKESSDKKAADEGFIAYEDFKEQVKGGLQPSKEQQFPSQTSVEIHDTDGGRSTSNYASLDAGSTILDTSDGTKSASNILVRDNDRYMLMPREQAKKWIVISLSEDVRADSINRCDLRRFTWRPLRFPILKSFRRVSETFG